MDQPRRQTVSEKMKGGARKQDREQFPQGRNVAAPLTVFGQKIGHPADSRRKAAEGRRGEEAGR